MLLMCAVIAGKAVRIELKSSNRDNITTTSTSDVVTAMSAGIAGKAVISKADASDICCGVLETASKHARSGNEEKYAVTSRVERDGCPTSQVVIVGDKSENFTLKLRGKAECDLEDIAKNGELWIVKRRPYLCCSYIWCSNEYNKDYQWNHC